VSDASYLWKKVLLWGLGILGWVVAGLLFYIFHKREQAVKLQAVIAAKNVELDHQRELEERAKLQQSWRENAHRMGELEAQAKAIHDDAQKQIDKLKGAPAAVVDADAKDQGLE
jgi:predicted Holliday junction resolvase-like endonuclease